ncbi:MAG: SDR family NAD(P)-dependent oxidoreductase [Chlamydiia bacterium]|nr:SDR family NAD(P)-dependent oxidoreductase [Chlamydiia bacterium]
MKNVIVTGGAGFIGSYIAEYHLNQGDKVLVIDNLQTGSERNIEPFKKNPNFKFVQANILDFSGLESMVKEADAIYHMAASVGQKYVLNHPVNTISNNIDGAERLFEAMSKSKTNAKILIASTSEVYCHLDIPQNEKVPENVNLIFPTGKFLQETYPVGKYVNEIMALSFAHSRGIKVTIARLFNTIGARQSPAYGMVVPNFLKQALSGKPITVFGDGLQTRSFSNVKDTVKALSLLMETPKSSGEIVNVGDDRECSILDLAKLIKKITDSDSEIVFMDYKEAYGVDFVDVRRRCPDLTKLRALTGFAPSIRLEETLKEIAQEVKVVYESQAAQ